MLELGGRACAGCGVRTNADTPEDARKAREFGAEGIGLCRTEHMFMAAERQPKMRAMIMAEEEDERRAALDELLPLQQEDFEGLFEEMAGLPVTIRLLDPPLHEFLPHRGRSRRRSSGRGSSGATTSSELERTLERVHHLAGDQPDARHARLPPRDPPPRDLRDAGARDRARRAAPCRSAAAAAPQLEIMIPLVAYEKELELMRELVERDGRGGGRRRTSS